VILAIGDSNLYAACTESAQPMDPTNMAVVFGDLLAQPLRCWSKNGASNHWIQTHIEYFLADKNLLEHSFLFVGWTSWEREEWPWLYHNISVCGGPDFGVPEPMKPRYQQWKQTLTNQYMQQCQQHWHDRIHQVHMALRQANVAHLFWTTYDNFHAIADKKDWHDNFYRPYDINGCMSGWFKQQGLLSVPGDAFHWGAQAHRAWATELASYARDFCQKSV